MAGMVRKKIELPRSTRQYRFSLVPLADTMFQLLIFFMLSANLTPYSLLTIRNGALGGTGGSENVAEQAKADVRVSNPMTTAVWSVSADSVVANGQRFPVDRIPDLATALKLQNTPEVLLVSQRGATVQMLVTILEILAQNGITAVRVADGGSI